MELRGCTAIVTGGSGGLGERAIDGVNVVGNYAATAAERTLLRRTVDKDDVAG